LYHSLSRWTVVPIVFNALIGLIAVTPAMAILEGQMARDAVTVIILTTLAFAAYASSAKDIAHAAGVTRGLRFIAAVPVIWFIVQIMPLPYAFSNSIWAAAAIALGQPLYGHISIDIGNTADATITYFASMALIFVAILAAKGRDRAELLLYCLCIVTTFTVVALWFFQLAPNPTGGEFATYSRDMLAGTAAQGTVLNLAAVLRTVERHKSWNGEKRLSPSAVWLLSLCLACMAICLLAIVFMTSANIGIATSFGLVTLCFEEVIRRGRLAAWSSLTLGATLLSILAMIVAWQYNSAQPSFFSLRFSEAPAQTVATVERMLSDLPWAGNGAGTFQALWRIYHNVGETATAQVPTTAASIMIGGGAILALTAIVGAVLLLVILFRGALARGRDSLYPATAAASIAILFGEAFCDASLLTTGVTLIATISIGLGLTQSG
jgi:hypothetical protein